MSFKAVAIMMGLDLLLSFWGPIMEYLSRLLSPSMIGKSLLLYPFSLKPIQYS